MYIRASFATGEIYHVYNRGVAKQVIFHNDHDYRHFLETIAFYLEAEPSLRFSKTDVEARGRILMREPEHPLVEVLAYCLMPNHFHFILRQQMEDGVSTLMRRALNSYTRAYNTKYKRIGTAFQGVFSAVHVASDEQFLHLTRYQHLNPYVARLVKRPDEYRWSSYPSYLQQRTTRLCHPNLALAMVGGAGNYRQFVEDYAAYAYEISLIKDLTIDAE